MSPAVVARGAGTGLVAGAVAGLVLLGFAFVLIGDAGADWEDSSAQVSVVVVLMVAAGLAAATGAAAGTWQAAMAGAPTKRAAMAVGAAGPFVPGALYLLLNLEASAGYVLGVVLGVLALGAGAAAGAWWLGRRLEAAH